MDSSCLRTFKTPLVVLIAASVFATAGVASAQKDEPCVPGKPCAAAQPASPPKKQTQHKAAGRGHRGKPLKIEGPIALWPGFRMLPGGGSQVVVQLNQKVQPQVIKTQGMLTYILPGFHVPVHNNTHTLMTQYFNTPVADARLVQTKDEVRLIVVLRAIVEPTVHLAENDPGKAYELQIQFPPGDYHPEIHDLHGPNNEHHNADRGHGREPGAPPAARAPRHRTRSAKTMGPPAP